VIGNFARDTRGYSDREHLRTCRDPVFVSRASRRNRLHRRNRSVWLHCGSKPTALALNVLVAAIGWARFYRLGLLTWPSCYPFAIPGAPFSPCGGTVNHSNSQAQRRRSAGLARRHPRRHRRSQDHRSRCAAALGLARPRDPRRPRGLTPGSPDQAITIRRAYRASAMNVRRPGADFRPRSLSIFGSWREDSS
jgi:hypothetical protein